MLPLALAFPLSTEFTMTELMHEASTYLDSGRFKVKFIYLYIYLIKRFDTYILTYEPDILRIIHRSTILCCQRTEAT